MQAWRHMEPSSAAAACLAALLALRRAAEERAPGAYRRALAAGRSALALAERQQSPVRWVMLPCGAVVLSDWMAPGSASMGDRLPASCPALTLAHGVRLC